MATPNRDWSLFSSRSDNDEVWTDDITTGHGEFYIIHSITNSNDPHPICTVKCYCSKTKDVDLTHEK